MDSIPFMEGRRLPELKSLTDPWLMPSCAAASICVQSAASSSMRKLAVKRRRESLSDFDLDMTIPFRYIEPYDMVSVCLHRLPMEQTIIPPHIQARNNDNLNSDSLRVDNDPFAARR